MSRSTNRTTRGRRGAKPPTNVVQFRGRSPNVRWRKPQPKNAKWPFAVLLASPLIGLSIAWAWNSPSASAEGLTRFWDSEPVIEQYNLSFSECSGPNRYTCVVDGDTFWLEGVKVRIADINTPEVSSPECPIEANLGAQATRRLTSLLNAGGFSLETIDRDEDGYGRKLRIVTRGGESLGETLVEEGLAERWQGRRGGWC